MFKNGNTWTAQIEVNGLRLSFSNQDPELVRRREILMQQRALEVKAGLPLRDAKAYILQDGDPYATKDERRRTWTNLAWDHMTDIRRRWRSPRAIILAGLRPEARSAPLREPCMGLYYHDVVMVERDAWRIKLAGDHRVIRGDIFEVLYEKAFKPRSVGLCSRFTLVDYDVCESGTEEVLAPFVHLVENWRATLTEPCCVRIVTSQRGGPSYDWKQATAHLNARIHALVPVRNYYDVSYKSTGMPMFLQQWVIGRSIHEVAVNSVTNTKHSIRRNTPC